MTLKTNKRVFIKLANTLSGKHVIASEDKYLRNTSWPLVNKNTGERIWIIAL